VTLEHACLAIQTRRQELADAEALQESQKRLLLRAEMKTRNKKLAGVAKQSGVVQPVDYAIFMDHGYRGLYGGLKRVRPEIGTGTVRVAGGSPDAGNAEILKAEKLKSGPRIEASIAQQGAAYYSKLPDGLHAARLSRLPHGQRGE
jgi:hypothetical protein